MVKNTSVVDTIKAAGWYREAGRLPEQTLKTVLPNGEVAEHTMAELAFADVMTFADEMDVLIAYESPVIQGIFAKNAEAIVNAIRVVNKESMSGFKGVVGSGRQLDILMFRPEQFQNPAAAGIAVRATWLRNVAAAPQTCQIICAPDALGIDTHGALTMATTEAFLLFGFANTSVTPVTTAIQITYLAQTYNIQNCYFGLGQVTESYYPFVELKEPLVIYPQESGLVTVRYSVNGADELTPVGLWIKMSQNLRSLLIS